MRRTPSVPAEHIGWSCGDDRCGGERDREQVKNEKTGGGQAERYLPGKLGGDRQQIIERGLSGSSHVLFHQGRCESL